MKVNLETIKKYWCYNDISKNYNIKIKELKNSVNVFINYLDGVKFEIEKINVNNENLFIIFDTTNKDYKKNITNCLEYIDTIEDCIKGCLYYFNTRY